MDASSLHQQIRRTATAEEVALAAEIIAETFTTLQTSAWLVPDPEERFAVLAGVFRIIAEHAFEYGHIDLVARPTDATRTAGAAQPAGVAQLSGLAASTDGSVGAAVWFHGEHPVPPPPDYAERLRLAAGEHTSRFEILDDLFDAHHPHEPHHHLALLAVLPTHQRRGIGRELLRHHHEILERDQIRAYLEASSVDSRRLYAGHGYRDRGQTFTLPNGATFYPMWRDPESGRPI
jgi:ribosomal protein S18 acetylase RimI-like enzyme